MNLQIERGLQIRSFVCDKTSGMSMWPCIWENDTLYIEEIDFVYLRLGDIIVYMGKKPGAFISHRIIRKRKNLLITKGDGALRRFECIEDYKVIGRLKYIIRQGKRIDLHSSLQKKINRTMAFLSLWFPFPLYAVKKVMQLPPIITRGE